MDLSPTSPKPPPLTNVDCFFTVPIIAYIIKGGNGGLSTSEQKMGTLDFGGNTSPLAINPWMSKALLVSRRTKERLYVKRCQKGDTGQYKEYDRVYRKAVRAAKNGLLCRAVRGQRQQSKKDMGAGLGNARGNPK